MKILGYCAPQPLDDSGGLEPLQTFPFTWCVIMLNLVALLQCNTMLNRPPTILPHVPLSTRVGGTELNHF